MAGKIYSNRMSASMIASRFRAATGKPIDPGFVHWLAKKKGFSHHNYGKEIYYSSNLRTVLDNNYATLYPQYLKELEQKKAEKAARDKARAESYPHPDSFHDPHCYDESVIRKAVMESINKLLRNNK